MKNLDYYMGLPYKIEITPIPEEQGGGFMATLPEIGRYAITGDGDTVEEALENLAIVKREQFEIYLDEGIKINEPEKENQYSGRFPLRLPKYLHKDLAKSSKSEGMSLNSYILSLIASSNELAQTRTSIAGEIKQCIVMLTQQISQLSYITTKEKLKSKSTNNMDEFNNYTFKKAA